MLCFNFIISEVPSSFMWKISPRGFPHLTLMRQALNQTLILEDQRGVERPTVVPFLIVRGFCQRKCTEAGLISFNFNLLQCSTLNQSGWESCLNMSPVFILLKVVMSHEISRDSSIHLLLSPAWHTSSTHTPPLVSSFSPSCPSLSTLQHSHHGTAQLQIILLQHGPQHICPLWPWSAGSSLAFYGIFIF